MAVDEMTVGEMTSCHFLITFHFGLEEMKIKNKELFFYFYQSEIVFTKPPTIILRSFLWRGALTKQGYPKRPLHFINKAPPSIILFLRRFVNTNPAFFSDKIKEILFRKTKNKNFNYLKEQSTDIPLLSRPILS